MLVAILSRTGSATFWSPAHCPSKSHLGQAPLGERNCWAISLKELVLKGLILAVWDDLVTLVAPPVWRWE